MAIEILRLTYVSFQTCMQAEGYDVIYFIQHKYLKMDLFKVM